MTNGVLPATARRLTHLVATEQASARMPSLMAGVVRDADLVWTGSRGATVRRGDPRPPDPDTQYRIGSITKTLTALLMMQLRDEGRLDLGDRLGQHLPGVGYGDRTLRELLSHSSGMQAEPPGPWWERSPGQPWDALVDPIDEGDAVAAAGRGYHYSNLGFALLGGLVGRLRGGTWFEAATAHLLEPLGMRRTTYLPRQPAADGFSVHAFAGTLTDEPAQDTRAMAPAGQVWSTVSDLATLAAFLAEPREDVLAASSVEEMVIVQSGTSEEGLAGGYGLGLRLTTATGRTYVGHTGSMPGFLAGLFVDRERRTGAVCLANGTAGLRCEGLPLDLLTTLEQHEPSLPAAWTPTAAVPGEIGDVLGLWHWGNTALSLSYDGTELVLARLGTDAGAYRYRPAGPDTFVGTRGYHEGETLRVVRRADRTVSHLECATFVYTRIPYDPDAPIPGGVPGLSEPG